MDFCLKKGSHGVRCCFRRDQLTQFSHLLQKSLFPVLEEETGSLSEPAKRLVSVLAMVPLQRYLPVSRGWNGRPAKDRHALACAFIAKAVYNLTTTRQLIERLQSDEPLRRICGWRRASDLPHESTFSRAFSFGTWSFWFGVSAFSRNITVR